MKTKSILLTLFLVLPASAADRPDAVVKYRQSVMKTLGAQMTAISLLAKGDVSLKTRLPLHTAALASMSRDLPPLFPKDVTTPHSDALPRIWTEWSAFSANAKKLETETAKLDAAAHSGDAAAVKRELDAVGGACKGCHDDYKRD